MPRASSTSAVQARRPLRALAMNRAIVAMHATADLPEARRRRERPQGLPRQEPERRLRGEPVRHAARARVGDSDGAEGQDRAVLGFLDSYNDRIATSRTGTDKLKWGTEWLPAEDVKRYREAQGRDGLNVTLAAKQLVAARARLKTAQDNLAAAKKKRRRRGRGEKAVESAQEQVAAAEKTVQAAAATMQAPKWLEKFDPVVPVP